MRDLIRMPYSEVTATLELFDRFGVTAEDFANLRKASFRNQSAVGRILKTDQFLWSLLEIETTAKKVGFTESHWKELAKSEEKLRVMLSLIGLTAKPEEVIINCDTDPFVPEEWKVKIHKKGGLLKWEPLKIKLYLSEKQKDGKVVDGNKLRKELENMPVLNANVLDFLLANQHLIPEEWKGKYIFFWGTTYRISLGFLHVRSLHWNGSSWCWRYRWLGFDWRVDFPAALLAS